MNNSTFKILAIDGGGMRGVFPAHILSCMIEHLGIRPDEHLDMIAGTSTGSIIAAAIACKIDPKEVISLYREHGSVIFSKKRSLYPLKYRPAFRSLYGNEHLKAILKKMFGDIKLGEITIPLLLPATDIGNGGVHVFKSAYSRDFVRDREVLLREAVLASCSAPAYFNPTRVNEYLLADGGLWANNPSLAAIIDAQRHLSIDLANLRILSLGTGHAKTCYGVKADRKWGFLNGWRGKDFISFTMSLQGQSIHNYVQLMLNKDQVLRIDFESDCPLSLDDCSAIDDLISKADRTFTHSSQNIRNFLNTN